MQQLHVFFAAVTAALIGTAGAGRDDCIAKVSCSECIADPACGWDGDGGKVSCSSLHTAPYLLASYQTGGWVCPPADPTASGAECLWMAKMTVGMSPLASSGVPLAKSGWLKVRVKKEEGANKYKWMRLWCEISPQLLAVRCSAGPWLVSTAETPSWSTIATLAECEIIRPSTRVSMSYEQNLTLSRGMYYIAHHF